MLQIDVFSKEIVELGVFGNVLLIINSIVMFTLIIFYTHQHIYALFGLFTKSKTFSKAQRNHHYAVLICARNEEKVIGNLIDSIKKQNYPQELIDVFVIADNCTDKTAEIGKEKGAIVYERKNELLKGKSYALDFLLRKIVEEGKDKDIEAYFIFDADNLLSKNYIEEMNKAFDVGIKVCTSFRNSKNYNVNWVSNGAAMSFYRECLLVHHSRSLFHLGTYVSGTGFYISKDIIKKSSGWRYHTLVEDIEFSIDCALNDIYIGYNEQAEFFDEQPIDLKTSLKQRLRWCKGTHQCFKLYEWKMIKKLFRNFKLTCVDLIIHITPFPVMAVIWLIVYLIAMGINCLVLHLPLYFYLHTAILNTYSLFLITFIVAFVHALIVTIKLGKKYKLSIWKKIIYCFTFPIYMFFYLPLSFIALFKKVSWVPIDHNDSKSIDNIE